MKFEPIPHMRPPHGEPAPDLSRYTHAWRYEDACGMLICYVVRWINNEGDKIVHPLSWCTLGDGGEGWAAKGPPDAIKPVYRLKELDARPDAVVVVCEGEKAADAAQFLLPDHVCIAWLGGANCASKPDWSCLNCRNVILWPDMDERREFCTREEAVAGVIKDLMPKEKQPGWSAMMNISGIIEGKASSVHILDYTLQEKKAGWDAADALEDGIDAMAFIEERKIDIGNQVDLNAYNYEELNAIEIRSEMKALDFFSESSKEPPILQAATPKNIAEAFLVAKSSLNIARYRGEWAVYNGGSYQSVSDEWLGAQITRTMESFKVKKHDKDGAETGVIINLPVRKATTAEVLHSMLARKSVMLGDSLDAPMWRSDHRDNNPIDCVALRNGVYDTRKMQFLGARPELFLLGNAHFDFDADAPKPSAWFDFLTEIFLHDPESIKTLQEWMGYQLTYEYSHHKSLYIVGPRRAGKGTIASIMTALVGRSCASAITVEQLAKSFGIEKLIGRRTAIIADARFTGRNVQDATPTVLSITSNDDVSIERKYLRDWHGRLGSKLTIMSNDMPSLRDDSGALAGRFIFMRLEKTFYGNEDLGLTERLMKDLPGIFLWALEGLARLRKQKHFTSPAEHQSAQDEAHESASPVVAFLNQCCKKQDENCGYEEWEFCSVLYEHFEKYCEKNGIKNVPAARQFGKSLKAAWNFIGRDKRQSPGTDRLWAYLKLRYIGEEN